MTTDEMIEVLQAHKAGKRIEVSLYDEDKWKEACEPSWDFDSCKYRVKPEPTCRPYKDTDEMVADYDARFQSKARPDHTMPLIWVKGKRRGRYLIEGYSEDGKDVYCGAGCMNMSGLFAGYSYLDGSPCGVLEE